MVNKTKCAFTLAEVLITLVIIGIVAALTIPTAINKTRNQEIVSKLKKTYSAFAQATNNIIAEEGLPKSWYAHLGSGDRPIASPDYPHKYIKYLNTSKICDTVPGCFSQKIKEVNNSGRTFEYTFEPDGSRYFNVILSDGVQVHFGDFYPPCNLGMTYDGYGCSCWIYVDVNGEKGPNVMGRDVFSFSILNDRLVPTGCTNFGSNLPKVGMALTCKVLREGAINY